MFRIFRPKRLFGLRRFHAASGTNQNKLTLGDFIAPAFGILSLSIWWGPSIIHFFVRIF